MAAHSTGRLFARRPFLCGAAVIDACRGEVARKTIPAALMAEHRDASRIGDEVRAA